MTCSPICILQGTKHEQCRWKPIGPELAAFLTEAQVKSGMVIGNKKDSVVCSSTEERRSYIPLTWV